ncbi:MAG: efflux RND transporter periplasmic adaptor subunit [Acidobacteria bacterium]|nr:efflux RND transporter periplasmic adaptor subunit [Acidobacteriota bacterium]
MAVAILIFLSAGLVMTACGPRRSRGPKRGIPEVSIVTMKAKQLVLTTELPGRTAPFRIAEIRPQVSGLIIKRLFIEGSDVKAGQVLYQIDPERYKAAYEQAKAAVAAAEAALPALYSREKRMKGLVAIHAVGQQEYDDALSALRQTEARLKESRAAMETAKIDLSYTPVKAPISGKIGRSTVTEGALVTAYQPRPLATIQQLNPIYVDVSQSTRDLLQLKKRLADGQLKHNNTLNKVKLILENGAAYPLAGKLKFRDITVDPTTGSVILRIVVPNPDHMLLPGMFVRAIVEEGIKPDAILVPQQGVRRNSRGNPFALVVGPGNKVQMRKLVLDRAFGSKWLVSSGLKTGDRVIVEGILRIRPGMRVKATEFTGDKATGARGGQHLRN